MALRATAVCLLAILALSGCGSGSKDGSKAAGDAPTWPAPPDPMKLTKQAGLVPEQAEYLQYHVHAHLDVFFNGEPIVVPAGIGIDTSNPNVVSDTRGVGLKQPCEEPCISPLHTHATDGILHTETKTPQPNQLGQLFTQWAVRLTKNCVGGYCKPAVPIKIYVDGKVETGDPTQIELKNLREVAVVIGTPPATIPEEFPR